MYRSRVAGWVYRRWRYRLTRLGRAMVLGIIVTAMAGGASVAIPIYHIFCVLFSLFAVGSVAGFVFRPRVHIVGEFPAKASAGTPFTAEFALTRRSLLPAFDVCLSLQPLPRFLEQVEPVAAPELPRRQSVPAPVTIRPHRRGLYELPDLRAASGFPFHFVRSLGSRHALGALLVLPHFHRIGALDIPMGKRHQPGGVALTANVGESPEYIGNREYHEGDSPRRLDYHSWARLGQPVVREYQEEYYCRIALIVDTFVERRRKEGPAGFAELEAAISLAAAAADALTRGENIIDIFAAGPELYVFRAGRNIAHLDNVLEILACVQACRANPFETLAPALFDELHNITTVVYVMLDWDAAREGFVHTAIDAGASVKVILVRDGATTSDYRAAESWAGPITALSPAAIREGRVESL